MRRAHVIGLLLLVLTFGGWTVAPRVVLASLLAAWWWALGIVLGSFANAWISTLSGGAWGGPVRATALVLARRMPWLLLGLVGVAFAMQQLYPWAMGGDWTQGIERPAFVRAWLSTTFFTVRLVVYALLWWWLAQGAATPRKGRAAASLIAYMLSVTLAAVDMLMSLMPQWWSTAFGFVAMSSQALSGAAAIALLTVVRRPRDWRAASKVPVSRDLGNLLLMWVMSWGYLAFMQFLVIWAENIPREIAWYVPRMQTGWRWIGIALIVIQLAVPFVSLLFRGVKDRPARLALVAFLLLAATALDAAWLVLPSVAAHDLHGWWLQPLALAGAALLLFGGVPTPVPHVPAARASHA